MKRTSYKPVHSLALDHSIQAIGKHGRPLARCLGGYGLLPRSFVALKTAKRLVENGLAIADPKLGKSGSSISLTPLGQSSFAEVVSRRAQAGMSS